MFSALRALEARRKGPRNLLGQCLPSFLIDIHGEMEAQRRKAAFPWYHRDSEEVGPCLPGQSPCSSVMSLGYCPHRAPSLTCLSHCFPTCSLHFWLPVSSSAQQAQGLNSPCIASLSFSRLSEPHHPHLLSLHSSGPRSNSWVV